MIKYASPKSGFTLLEVLISTGIFMVVMVVAVSVFGLSVGTSSAAEQTRVTAQSARLAFESITREIRLSHGLVYTDPADNTAKLVVPPFEVQPDSTLLGQNTVRVYQAVSAGDDPQGHKMYSLSRKTYHLVNKPIGSKQAYQLMLCTQQSLVGAGKTVAQLYTLFNANAGDIDASVTWSPSNCANTASSGTDQSVLSSDLAVDQFTVVNKALYPTVTQPLSSLKLQPFIELDLTASNPRYNANRNDNTQVRVTLRSMIVPRNFLSPFEVVQPGVQGATQ